MHAVKRDSAYAAVPSPCTTKSGKFTSRVCAVEGNFVCVGEGVNIL